MFLKLSLLTVVLTVLEIVAAALDDEPLARNDSLKILSRRKRYLVFPEGSSLQLGE